MKIRGNKRGGKWHHKPAIAAVALVTLWWRWALQRPMGVLRAIDPTGTGDVFSKGRDFAAWLGLVPRHISTGDGAILGSISKRGSRYLRLERDANVACSANPT
jgi:hypothetical protein